MRVFAEKTSVGGRRAAEWCCLGAEGGVNATVAPSELRRVMRGAGYRCGA